MYNIYIAVFPYDTCTRAWKYSNHQRRIKHYDKLIWLTENVQIRDHKASTELRISEKSERLYRNFKKFFNYAIKDEEYAGSLMSNFRLRISKIVDVQGC